MFDDTNLRNAYKQAIIISIAFFFSVVVYAGLAEFFLAELQVHVDSSLHGILRYIFIALSAGQIFLMVILKNRILSGETNFSFNSGFETEANGTEADPERNREAIEAQFLQRLRSAHIVTYALCESIAFYGLILFILGKDKTEFYAFLGVGIFMMMVNFPRYDDWKSRLGDVLNDM